MFKSNPNLDHQIYYGANQELLSKAKELRLNLTKAEKILWEELRNKNIDGYIFRRQHPIYIFIADFYCHEKKLVIEVDGGYHKDHEQKQYDISRTNELGNLNIKVIRFINHEVETNIQDVLAKVRVTLISV